LNNPSAELWLTRFAGSTTPEALANAITQQYGKDRTFSAPILTMCALAGRLGSPEHAWLKINPLPFELSACPHQFFKWLHLPVVSYAMPALIAIGYASYYHRRPANPVARLLRYLTRGKALAVLRSIQPESGGFLEAIPLTSFVVMSLAASGQNDNEVVFKGTEFLAASVRDDGNWPIDTNLATWVTTLCINALAEGRDFSQSLSLEDRRNLQTWLLSQQCRREHLYTHAEPGGWAWTNLSGAVPDADDTAGALIALHNLDFLDEHVINSAIAGVKWLLGLQNRDGGIPTFCRGWSALAFDRSAPDLIAHAIRAFNAWIDVLPVSLQKQVTRAIERGLAYLENVQRQDGSWVPLWFGNQFAPNQENPVYGTARVISGLFKLNPPMNCGAKYICCEPMIKKGVQWLLSAQNQDGGWGGSKSVSSTIEETSLAVDALAEFLKFDPLRRPKSEILEAISRGVSWLIEHTQQGTSLTASPIGLYFARLWYFEQLYPAIFTLSALNKVQKLYCVKSYQVL
jgi:squalene-hopene/tetraprenyl-beta-curcumene cyclase